MLDIHVYEESVSICFQRFSDLRTAKSILTQNGTKLEMFNLKNFMNSELSVSSLYSNLGDWLAVWCIDELCDRFLPEMVLIFSRQLIKKAVSDD